MAALGFGIAGFEIGECVVADSVGFFAPGFGGAPCVAPATVFGAAAGDFPATFFELVAFAAFGFLTLAFGAGFFADADSSFLSVNSNAGLGRVRSCGTMRVINAAGFTPAATAAFAAEAANAGCFDFDFPSRSGLTITWLS